MPHVVDGMVQADLGSGTVRSKCACGSVQIEISNISPTTVAAASCHCRKCRKYHISAFTNYLIVKSGQVSFIKGDDRESSPNNQKYSKLYKDSCDEIGAVERLFCQNCYSKIWTRRRSHSSSKSRDVFDGQSEEKEEEDDIVLVNMGPLDDDTVSPECSTSWKENIEQWQLDQACTWTHATPKLRNIARGKMPTKQASMVTGGCSCGTYLYEFPVRYESTVLELQHCYCRLCRRLSGSPFATWVPVGIDELEWKRTSEDTATHNPPQMIRTTPFGQRHVCPNCAGVLTIVYDSQPDLVWPAAGGFDDSNVPRNFDHFLGRVIHICCRWKQSWYDIPLDGMQQLENAC